MRCQRFCEFLKICEATGEQKNYHDPVVPTHNRS
ncbi:hypothetical protein APTSU1_000507800 [Apodemus speciosus]|uniref:Uncharacterized protein n=1 Tax=Apodemus speciosus TaxID=105296 RepID=A0ABQ0ES21_APOSI